MLLQRQCASPSVKTYADTQNNELANSVREYCRHQVLSKVSVDSSSTSLRSSKRSSQTYDYLQGIVCSYHIIIHYLQ